MLEDPPNTGNYGPRWGNFPPPGYVLDKGTIAAGRCGPVGGAKAAVLSFVRDPRIPEGVAIAMLALARSESGFTFGLPAHTYDMRPIGQRGYLTKGGLVVSSAPHFGAWSWGKSDYLGTRSAERLQPTSMSVKPRISSDGLFSYNGSTMANAYRALGRKILVSDRQFLLTLDEEAQLVIPYTYYLRTYNMFFRQYTPENAALGLLIEHRGPVYRAAFVRGQDDPKNATYRSRVTAARSLLHGGDDDVRS